MQGSPRGFSAPDDGWETRFVEYQSEMATLAIDLAAAEGDLESSLEALIAYGSFSGIDRGELIQAQALWTHALSMYCRCFSEGRRPRIKWLLDQVIVEWPHATVIHEHVRGERNRHVAHVVSDLERTRTALEIGRKSRSDGSWALRIRPVGLIQTATGPVPEAPVESDFKQLLDRLLAKIAIAIEGTWEAVSAEAKAIGPDALSDLPPVQTPSGMGLATWRRSRR